MYVCLCNAISEEDVTRAIEKYDSIDKWFALQNIAYKCALCRKKLEETFKENKEKKNDIRE